MPRSYFQTHSTQKKLGHRILTNCAHHKTSKSHIWGSMLDEQTTVARQPRLAHCLLLYMKFHRSPAVHFCAVCGCFSAPTAVWVALQKLCSLQSWKACPPSPSEKGAALQFPAGAYRAPARQRSLASGTPEPPPPRISVTRFGPGEHLWCDISRCTRGPGLSALSKRHDVVTMIHSLTPFLSLKEAAESRRQKQKSPSTETLRSPEPGWESRWGTGDEAPLRSRPGLGAFPGWEAEPALLQPWPRAAGAHLSQEQKAAAQQAGATIPEGKNRKSYSDDPLPEKRKTSKGPRIVTDNRSRALKYWAMQRKEAGHSPVPTGNNNKYFIII